MTNNMVARSLEATPADMKHICFVCFWNEAMGVHFFCKFSFSLHLTRSRFCCLNVVSLLSAPVQCSQVFTEDEIYRLFGDDDKVAEEAHQNDLTEVNNTVVYSMLKKQILNVFSG